VNGVPIFIRGGDWGLDEAMKRIPLERLDAEIHLHQLANLNMIRNWVGQSTGEDFYELCDKYGILVWDEFFQANPNDGPDPTDIPTYIANVRDKVLRFRNHPSIALWCARNEGYPSKHNAISAQCGATRRDFLQGSLAVAGSALAFSVASSPLLAESSAKRPNLVFFLGEGQRAEALSIAGNPILKTPNHDRIGREGMRFENAFCTNALCGPARAVALSGMYSRSTGALSNEHLNVPLPSDIPLFTDILREAGYEIAIVGKVHIGNGVEERNWDYYFGHNDASNNYANPFFKEGRNGKVGPQKQYQNMYPDDLAVDRALAWLEEDRGGKPFCLLVWFVAPHEPFFRPRRHLDLFRGAVTPKPETFDADLKGYPGKPKGFIDAENKIGTTPSHPACGSLEGMTKDYYSGLVAVDENIGRIVSYLEKKNILDDTAIIQTSDRGYLLGEWRMFDKRLMHEPSIRVPLMVRYALQLERRFAGMTLPAFSCSRQNVWLRSESNSASASTQPTGVC
jgi:hypothetical protein